MLKYSILIFIIFLVIASYICYCVYKEHFTESKLDILKKYIVSVETRNIILSEKFLSNQVIRQIHFLWNFNLIHFFCYILC